MIAADLGLAASLACSVAFYAVAGVVAVTRRSPSPISLPATSDLGAESPAVANLLVNGGRLTPDAVPATLFDLAARHVVMIEETEVGVYACRIASGSEATLTPYERQVFDLLRERAVDGVIPAKALTAGPVEQARAWIKRFNKQVIAEADRGGACKPRWPSGALALMGGLGTAAFLLAAYSNHPAEKVDVLQLIAIAVSGLTFVVMSRAFPDDTQVVTAAGLASQARWLALRRYLHDDELFAGLPPTAVAVRDRYIAYGAALGAATAAVRAMPMGAESDRWAWTRYGGHWRQVKVSYPRFWPPGWGLAPGHALWLALRMGAIATFWFWLTSKMLSHINFGAEADQLARALIAGIQLVNVGASVALVGALWLLLAALLALVGTSEVTGEAIRLRQRPGRNGVNCYVAVFGGSGDHVRAWVISPDQYATLKEYDVVTVSVATLLGHVRAVRLATDQGVSQSRPVSAAAHSDE